MPFNTNGVFQRLFTWVTDRDNGVKIQATRMDSEFDGIVSGLNEVVDGTRGFIGPVKSTNGTATAPTHSFTNDSNTGMYRKAADQLGFATGGVERLVVTDTDITFNGNSIAGGGTVNANTLEGENKSYFENATNLLTGTVPTARLPTGLTTETTLIQNARTFTAPQRFNISTVAWGNSITLDLSSSNDFSLTLTGDTTFLYPSNVTVGQSGRIVIRQNSTGGHSVASWNAAFKFQGGTDPVVSQNSNAITLLDYYVVAASEILVTSGTSFE